MNQLKAGAILSYGIITLNIIIGIAYTPFLLRMIGQAEYGIYSLVASVISYLTVLDLGFGNAIIRYTAKFRAENKQKEQYELFGMFIRLYLIIGILALLLGLCMYYNVDKVFGLSMSSEELDKIRIMIMIMSFNLAFTFPLSIFGSIISAYENFVFQKLINIVRIILTPVVMIILLLFGYKAIALVVVITCFNLLTLLINCWYCFNRLRIKVLFHRFNWTFLKEISIYSFWVFLNIIMDRIYWSTGQFMLGIYRGSEAIAVYAIAIQLKDMFFMFSTAISGVFLPKVTAMVTNGATDSEISDLFNKTGRIQYLIMSYIISGFILFGQPFINIWAGDEYSQAYPISLLLFIPSMIPLIQNIGITILMARNQLKFRSLLYLAISFSSILLAIPLAKSYGGIGCAMATSAALVIGQGVIMNIYYRNKVGIKISEFWYEIGKMSVIPILVVSILTILSSYFIINNVQSLILWILIFTVIFIPSSWIFTLNNYEKDLMKTLVSKLNKKIVK